MCFSMQVTLLSPRTPRFSPDNCKERCRNPDQLRRTGSEHHREEGQPWTPRSGQCSGPIDRVLAESSSPSGFLGRRGILVLHANVERLAETLPTVLRTLHSGIVRRRSIGACDKQRPAQERNDL